MKLCSLLLLLLLLLLTLFSVSISSSNPDLETLLAFKSTSDLSNSLSSWSNSSNPCSGSWLGVYCKNNSHRVTRLILQNLNLTGPIQSLTRLTQLRLLSLKHNNLSSSSLDFSSWKNMKLLYLSHNQFCGNFPSGISQLHRLNRLDLSHNRLSGRIPITQLTQLQHLLTLRLESNSFSGSLEPSQDFTFRTLLDFNVSKNNLSGKIPKLFSSFPSSCFTSNDNLCGNPLPNNCFNWTFRNDPIPIKVPHEQGGKKITPRTILIISIIDVAVVIAIAIGIFFYCRRRRLGDRNLRRETKKGGDFKNRDELGEEVEFFEGCKGFRVDDLLKASAEMLGKGNVGSTYKVLMDSGDVVVVKRVRREKMKKKEFVWLLREIGGLRHRNIVSLRAYYNSRDELLLVYDFLPNGSLHSLLHGNRGPGRTPLDWTTRLKLAADLAEGLAFLHSVSKSKLSHGHLTSCNVIIDQEGNACISDVALHQCFLTSPPSNSTYNAPELLSNAHNSRKFSQKCDVYSFGVILLEILTGKTATGEGETSLVKWVQCVVKEEWTAEVFDFELLRYKEMEEEMVALLQVALLCLTPMPRDRPKISDVHKMIEDIRSKGFTGGTHSPSVNDHSSDFSPTQSDHTPNFTSS